MSAHTATISSRGAATAPGVGTVLNLEDRAQLVARIMTLTADNPAQWGKMTATQMLGHCELFDRWIQKGGPNKQTLMGKIVGPFVLRSMMKRGSAMPKNVPTLPSLIAKEGAAFEAAREGWLTSLEHYSDYSAPTFVHDFFGPLTLEQVGAFVWKHADHHLKQFGA